MCNALGCDYAVPFDRIELSPSGIALLGTWQYYDGYCVLIARTHATELADLPDDERRAYLDEMCLLARAVRAHARPRKLNYELLGNQVPHLHWHLFPRTLSDPDGHKPVWLALDRAGRDPEERRWLETGPRTRAETTALLRQKLQELSPGTS